MPKDHSQRIFTLEKHVIMLTQICIKLFELIAKQGDPAHAEDVASLRKDTLEILGDLANNISDNLDGAS